MKPELYIAQRFAFKQRSASKPTFIVLMAVLGIAVGTAALILTLSIVNGFAHSIEQKLISFSAHLQIRQPNEQLFAERRSDMATIAAHPNIAEFSPFLEKSYVLRSRDGSGDVLWRSKPVLVKGVTEQQRQQFLQKFLKQGKATLPEQPNAIALYAGQPLAENMKLRVGQRVMLVGLGDNAATQQVMNSSTTVLELLSSLKVDVGVIRGIYDTGLQEGFDDRVMFADLRALQQQSAPGMISGFDANVHQFDDLTETVQSVVKRLGSPFYGMTVFDRYANLFEWLKLQQNMTPLLIVTITIVAVFNIISTLLVLMIEKTREIGMLSALGLKPSKIRQLFLVQASLISLSGIALGNLVALSFSLLEMRFHLITLPEKSYFINHVPLLINPADYVVVSLAVMVLTLLFALVPAKIAASLKPGTALGA